MPSVKFSFSLVALSVPPSLTLWSPAVYDEVGLAADVRQLAILGHAAGRDRRTDRRWACRSRGPAARTRSP